MSKIKNKYKHLAARLADVLLVQAGLRQNVGGGVIVKEDYDYYSASTMFMLDEMMKTRVQEFTIFSMAGMVRYVVPMMGIAKKLVHLSMIPMDESMEIETLRKREIVNVDFSEITGDFFDLQPIDERLKDVEFLVSHAAIHCMNDTRYGNDNGCREFKSYIFAEKLKTIAPSIKHVIVSVPVNSDERIRNNSTYLSDKKFIDSFEKVGYMLSSKYYDKRCLQGNTYEEGDRFSIDFPAEYCKKHVYVVGNYHFVKAEII